MTDFCLHYRIATRKLLLYLILLREPQFSYRDGDEISWFETILPCDKNMEVPIVISYLLEGHIGSIDSLSGWEACHLPLPKLHPFPRLDFHGGIDKPSRIVDTHNLHKSIIKIKVW